MAYNMTALDGANTFSEMLVGINASLNGAFISLFLFAFFIMLVIGFKRYGTAEGLIAASTIIILVSIPLISIGLLYYTYILLPITFLMGSIIYKVFN